MNGLEQAMMGPAPSLRAADPIERIAASMEHIMVDSNGVSPTQGRVSQTQRRYAWQALEAASAVPVTREHINLRLDTWLNRIRWIVEYAALNNGYAAKYLAEMDRGVIGPEGFHPEIFPEYEKRADIRKKGIPMKRAVEGQWKKMSAARQVGMSRMMSLRERDRLLLRTLLIQGEYFLVYQTDKTSPWGFSWKMVEPWRCPLGLHISDNRLGENRAIAYGRLVEEQEGEIKVVGYAFRKRTVYDDFRGELNQEWRNISEGNNEYFIYPAHQVRHVFMPHMSEQARGFPQMTPAIFSMVKQRKYEEAAMSAAYVSAMLHMVIEEKVPGTAGAGPSAADMENLKLSTDLEREVDRRTSGNTGDAPGSSSVHDSLTEQEIRRRVRESVTNPEDSKTRSSDVQTQELGANQEAKWAPANHPHTNFADFTRAGDAQMAAGLLLSREYATGKFDGSNYAVIQHAKNGDRAGFAIVQGWIVDGHLQFELERLIEYGLLPAAHSPTNMNGMLLRAAPTKAAQAILHDAAGEADWISFGWRGIDMAKQQNAMAKGLEIGTLTLSDALRGGEASINRGAYNHLLRLAYEDEMQDALGISIGSRAIREMMEKKHGKPKPAKEHNDERSPEQRKGDG